jgi:hypothetical protein
LEEYSFPKSFVEKPIIAISGRLFDERQSGGTENAGEKRRGRFSVLTEYGAKEG